MMVTKFDKKLPGQLKDQIINIFRALQDQRLLYYYNLPVFKPKENPITISYPNHLSGSHFTNHTFGAWNIYKSFLKKGEYSCIFKDGSIMQFYYEFEDSQLRKHSLTWWPCPFFIEFDETNDIPPIIDNVDDLSKNWQDNLVMRSPIRFDYDSKPHRTPDVHAKSHVHFNHKSCRMLVSHPLCVNRFVRFIFDFFYPNVQCDLPFEPLLKSESSQQFDANRAFLKWK